MFSPFSPNVTLTLNPSFTPRRWDTDGDGKLNVAEIQLCLDRALDCRCTREEVADLVSMYDDDGKSEISLSRAQPRLEANLKPKCSCGLTHVVSHSIMVLPRSH